MNQNPPDQEKILLDSAEEGDSCSVALSPHSTTAINQQEIDARKNELLELEYGCLKILYELDEKIESKRFSEILQKNCEQFFKTQNSIIQRLIYRTIFTGMSFLLQIEKEYIEVYKSSQDLFVKMKTVIFDQFGEDLASIHIEEVYLAKTRKSFKEEEDIFIKKDRNF